MERPKEHIDRSMDEAKDQANDKMQQAKDQAREGMHRAEEQVDRGREMAADRVDSAADMLHERAEEQGGMQGKVGAKAADGMEQAASYLRDHRTEDIWNDVEQYAKDHPMQALGGAIIGGFLLGRILR